MNELNSTNQKQSPLEHHEDAIDIDEEMNDIMNTPYSTFLNYDSKVVFDKLNLNFSSKYFLKEPFLNENHGRYFKLVFCSVGVFIFYLLYSILQEEIV